MTTKRLIGCWMKVGQPNHTGHQKMLFYLIFATILELIWNFWQVLDPGLVNWWVEMKTSWWPSQSRKESILNCLLIEEVLRSSFYNIWCFWQWEIIYHGHIWSFCNHWNPKLRKSQLGFWFSKIFNMQWTNWYFTYP